jgi:hypothetical protein
MASLFRSHFNHKNTDSSLLWDCMNLSSKLLKQIENSDSLVPKHYAGTISPNQDLQEIYETVKDVRAAIVPFVTGVTSKRKKMIMEPAFEICIKGIQESLQELHNFFLDLEKEFSIFTWKTQKVKIYQIDFLIKQKFDQFTALFNLEIELDKDRKNARNKNTNNNNGATSQLIQDLEAREFWIKHFGEHTMMVPFNVFLSTIETFFEISFKEDEESIKMILNFTKTDHVSTYELSIFLRWFGPFKGCFQRMIESVQEGLLCGFIPATEANLLLEGKRDGTYLIRCSKTQPGSFAVTFVDNLQKIKHCLLYSIEPHGLSLKNPPTIYGSLKEFAESHSSKLKHPLGNKWTLKKKLPGFAYDGKISNNQSNITSLTNNNNNNNQNNNNNSNQNNLSDNGLCIVCMDAPFETVFLECGHLACCLSCSGKLKLCPICRNQIVRVIPVFRAS